MEKFKNLTVDPDTILKSRNPIKLQNYDAMHEVWVWDGIKGESIIFVTADIKELTEEQITKLLESSGLIKDINSVTVSKGEGEFSFINFNFEY